MKILKGISLTKRSSKYNYNNHSMIRLRLRFMLPTPDRRNQIKLFITIQMDAKNSPFQITIRTTIFDDKNGERIESL